MQLLKVATLEKTLKIKLDTAQYNAEINKLAKQETLEQKMRLNIDTLEAKKELNNIKISTLEAKSKVVLDSTQFNAEISKLLKNKIVDAKIKLTLDTSEANKKIKEISLATATTKANLILDTAEYKAQVQKYILTEKLEAKVKANLDVEDLRNKINTIKLNTLNSKANIQIDSETIKNQLLKAKNEAFASKTKIEIDTSGLKKQLADVKLSGQSQKIQIDLDTAEYKKKQAEIRASILEMREQKMRVSLDTAKAKSELTGFQQFANSLLGKITFGNLIATGITTGISAITSALQGLMNVFKESVAVTAQYEISLKGLTSVSKAFGKSQGTATDMAQKLTADGLIPLNQATETLKNLISTGYSLDEAFTLANAMKNIGAFNNNIGDLGLAMATASRGLRINSIELIDNIGFTERLSNTLKKANVDISNGITLSDNASQRQAVLNAFLREASKNYGAASEYSQTYTGKIAQLNTAVKEMQASFGEFVTGPGTNIIGVLKLEAESLKTVLDYIKEINTENARRKSEQFPLQGIQERGGVKALNKDEVNEYMNIFETRWAQSIKTNGNAMKAVYEELKNKQLEINISEKVSTSDVKDKSRRQQQKEIEDNNKAYKEYFDFVKNKMEEINKRDKDYGKDSKEIISDKIRYIQSEMEKVDITSIKYQDLLKIMQKLNKEKVEINFEQITTATFNVDEESQKQFEKQWGDVVKLRQKINAIQQDWENKPPVFGWDAIKESALGNIDKQINTVTDAMQGLNTTTEEGKNQLQSMIQLLEKLKTDKISMETSFTTQDVAIPMAGISGIDYGSYYGKIQKDAINAQNETDAEKLRQQKIANRKSEAEQQDYYQELSKIQREQQAEQERIVRESQRDIANKISEIGNVLNNEFIKSLGDFSNSVLDIAQELQSFKMAQASGNKLGMVSSEIGIALAAINIGSSIANALIDPTDKQTKAANKMNEAAETIKKSFEGKTPAEMFKVSQGLSANVPVLKRQLENKQGVVDVLSSNLSQVSWIFSPVLYASIKEQLKKARAERDAIQNAYNATIATIDSLMPEIKNALNISWGDLASSVKSAFNADNLTDFYSTFKQNLSNSIKDSLISAFLQSTAMRTMFEGLSQDIYDSLKGVGFDLSTTEGQAMIKDKSSEWNKTIEEISKAGGSFYDVLQKLGLAGTSTAEALKTATNTINSIPDGVKVALYRFQSMTPQDQIKNYKVPTTEKALTGAYDTFSPTVEVYIGNEKLENIVTRVNVKNQIKQWGA